MPSLSHSLYSLSTSLTIILWLAYKSSPSGRYPADPYSSFIELGKVETFGVSIVVSTIDIRSFVLHQ